MGLVGKGNDYLHKLGKALNDRWGCFFRGSQNGTET